MFIAILAARGAVEIQNHVESMLSGGFHKPIQEGKGLRFALAAEIFIENV